MKSSSSAKVDIIEQKLYDRSELCLTEDERERLYWLYDNDVEFTYFIGLGNHVEIFITRDEDYMGYKLRWL